MSRLAFYFSTGIVGGGNSNKVYQLLMQMEMLSWNERISDGEWKNKKTTRPLRNQVTLPYRVIIFLYITNPNNLSCILPPPKKKSPIWIGEFQLPDVQRTAQGGPPRKMGNPELAKHYVSRGFPKNPKVEPNKYHGSTPHVRERGTRTVHNPLSLETPAKPWLIAMLYLGYGTLPECQWPLGCHDMFRLLEIHLKLHFPLFLGLGRERHPNFIPESSRGLRKTNLKDVPQFRILISG